MTFEDLTKNKNCGYLKSGRRQHCCSYNKNDYKTKIQNIFSDSTKFEKYEMTRISNLVFQSTVRRNSLISLYLYIKKCISLKTNMIAFTQRDQNQEYFIAVLRYIDL